MRAARHLGPDDGIAGICQQRSRNGGRELVAVHSRGGRPSAVPEDLRAGHELSSVNPGPGSVMEEASPAGSESTHRRIGMCGRTADPVIFGRRGWGLGIPVATQPDDPGASTGRYGWDGGFGTSWANDPAPGLIGILMTQAGGSRRAAARLPGVLEGRLRRDAKPTPSLIALQRSLDQAPVRLHVGF